MTPDYIRHIHLIPSRVIKLLSLGIILLLNFSVIFSFHGIDIMTRDYIRHICLIGSRVIKLLSLVMILVLNCGVSFSFYGIWHRASCHGIALDFRFKMSHRLLLMDVGVDV